MNKERLEEIKENAIKEKTHIKHIDTGESRWGHTYTLMDTDFDWFISTVKEQQKEIERWIRGRDIEANVATRAQHKVMKLDKENVQLRKALEFYADGDNYNGWRDNPGIIGNDGGEKARQALKE